MSEKIQVNAYRDWTGLNMTNSYWKDHNVVNLTNVEDVAPDLHLLDIITDPTIQNTYSNDAGIDGSRFEYNALEKTTITLKFYLEFSDYRDFLNKKHDIQAYWAAKAKFSIQTSYHPYIHAACYLNKLEMKPTSDHICLFDIVLDNAFGMWFTDSTSFLEKNWDSNMMRDLRAPTSLRKPSWDLHLGLNKVWIGGDVMSQFTNPVMNCTIRLDNPSNDATRIYNKTTNTVLETHGITNSGNTSSTWYWNNLNLTLDSGLPINDISNATDFWLDPGWNEIEINGASGGYLDVRFYYTNF